MEYVVTTQSNFSIGLEETFDHHSIIGGYTIAYNKGITFSRDGEDFFLLDGFVYDLSKKQRLSDKDLFVLLRNRTKWPDQITGQFAIIYCTKDKPQTLRLISDFVGMRHVYYGEIDQNLYVSNNFTRFHCIEKIEIDAIGLLQKLTPPFYSTLYERSLFRDIFRLLPATHLELSFGKREFISYDLLENIGSKKTDIASIQSLLKENGEIYNQVFDQLVLPISGGVDSRITLFSIIEKQQDHKYLSLTYGEPNFIDNKIASKIAKTFSIPHTNISINNIYPDKKVVQDYYLKGGNILLNIWVPVVEFLKTELQSNSDNTGIILGDILDLLRAKNVKSIRSRRKRILYQLRLLNAEKSPESSKNHVLSKLQRQLSQTYKNYTELTDNLVLSKSELLETSRKDVVNMLNHIDHLIPQNDCGYAYEEVFNIFNWGSNTMGNQMRVLNQYFPAFVLSANRHFIKTVLKIKWEYRFEDVLTHRILKKSKLSNFPTTQIPFLKYRRFLFLKYTLWATRSFIDQNLMKISSKFKWKRNRSIDTINWQLVYSNPGNSRHYETYFSKHPNLFSYPLKYYKNRATGKSRPLSEIDLTAAIVPSFVLELMKPSNKYPPRNI